jgi:hypothetical protein
MIRKSPRLNTASSSQTPAPVGSEDEDSESEASVSKDEDSESESNSDEEEDARTFLSLPPYGWRTFNMEDAKLRAEKEKEKFSRAMIPSFEVWCAMTMYDRTKAHGGPQFQKMVHYLLSDGRYSKNTDFYKSYWTNKAVHAAKPGAKENKDPYYDANLTRKGPAYISDAAFRMVNAKGGAIGVNSQGVSAEDSLGFTYGQGVEVAVSFRPGYKMNWLRAYGTSLGSLRSNDVASSQFSSGLTSGAGSAKEESTGENMSIGNRIAAIIGLYYYPNCEDESLNWVIEQKLQDSGVTYHIRMRLPNPNYRVDGDSLRVYEPLNRSSRKEHPEFHEIIGGENGFAIDMLHFVDEDRRVPMMWLNLFAHKTSTGEMQTVIAPFLGDKKHEFAKSKKAEEIRRYNIDLHKELGDVLYNANNEDGLILGFKMSKALWLYPHVHTPRDTYTVQSAYNAELAPGYMAAPELRSRFKNWNKGADLGRDQFSVAGLLFTDPSSALWQLLQRQGEHYKGTDIGKLRDYVLEVRDLPTIAPEAVSTSLGPSVSDTAEMDLAEEDEDPQDRPANPEVLRDSDNVTGTSGVSEQLTRDQGVTASVEFGGMGLGMQSLEDSLRESGNLKEASNNVSEAINAKALDPGDTPDRDANNHFYNTMAQPWPHSDLYETSKIELEESSMTDEQVKEYEQRYGVVNNLYIRSTSARKVTGIKVQYGKSNGRMNQVITMNNNVSRKNLRRILLIYYDNQDIGVNGHVISASEKRNGMLNGVWGCSKQTAQVYQYPKFVKSSTFNVPLWPPVFSKAPPEDWKECFNFTENIGVDRDLVTCMDDNEKYDMNQIKSNMTVLEWITSPWHYAYLPYQPQKAIFRDGETYSAGCNRCARPFYEYAEMYAPYKFSVPKTMHWPTMHWNVTTPGIAAQPFHNPDFWDDKQTAPIIGGKEVPVDRDLIMEMELQNGGELEDTESIGWHNWPVYKFKAYEQARMDKTLREKLITQKRPATFRKYNNHAYDDKVDYTTIGSIAQGRLTLKNAKIQFGQRNLKVTRASKYTNCCRDCANVLETAPGLYQRNYRVTKPLASVRGTSSAVDNNNAWWANILKLSTASGALIDPSFMHVSRNNLSEAQKTRFDDAMKAVSTYLSVQRHNQARNATKHFKPPDINIQHAVREPKRGAAMTIEAIKTLDKLLQQADMTVPAKNVRVAPTLTLEELRNPAFRNLVYELKRKYEHNEAFRKGRHVDVFDSNHVRIEYRNHTETYEGVEYKNCLKIVSYKPRLDVHVPKSKFKYDRDLDYETEIHFANKRGRRGAVKSGGSVLRQNYLVKGVKGGPSRIGTRETRQKTSQWGGDAFLIEFVDGMSINEAHVLREDIDSNAFKKTKQYRKLQQSRLFITYSLHRPVSDEIEARLVMERMADAAHLIFGDDRFISQLLVFGQKLAAFTRDEQEVSLLKPTGKSALQSYKEKLADLKTDFISSTAFVQIKEMRKKDSDAFYADGSGSSYMSDTYDSHVDKVEVDGGIEIGPIRKHPHFHILVTINHFSYVQLDYFKMNHYFELLFRGLDPYKWFNKPEDALKFKLLDASGGSFYTDNESPYVDIRLYPQDNWQDIIAAYVRKNNNMITALTTRHPFGRKAAP